jgi:hypothetical protein
LEEDRWLSSRERSTNPPATLSTLVVSLGFEKTELAHVAGVD